MNKIVTFSLIGKNKVGIIPQIFEHLYTNKINIQRSQLINMNDSFILHADAETKYNICVNKLLESYSNFVKINPKQIYYNYSASNLKIIVKNSDEPGIIHNTCKILNQKDITIYKMDSYLTVAPLSGHNIFNLNSYVYDSKDNYNTISEKLDNLGYDYQILKLNN